MISNREQFDNIMSALNTIATNESVNNNEIDCRLLTLEQRNQRLAELFRKAANILEGKDNYGS